MSGFSTGLKLTDLDDFIAPSQECIKPVPIKKTQTGEGTRIRVTDDGDYFQVGLDGAQKKLEKASITLNDCLACSGCITSAESVLITSQSYKELYDVVEQNRRIDSDKKVVVVTISPQSYSALASAYKLPVDVCVEQICHFLRTVMCVDYVFDSSFGRNISLMETAKEFVKRYSDTKNTAPPMESRGNINIDQSASDMTTFSKSRKRVNIGESNMGVIKSPLPLLTSSCPGWICYAEKTHGDAILPYMSRVRSPQQVMGSLVKEYLTRKIGIDDNNRIYHVSIMPCYDKKLEASRQDFYSDIYSCRDVDCVLTSGELLDIINDKSYDLRRNVILATGSSKAVRKSDSKVMDDDAATTTTTASLTKNSIDSATGVKGFDSISKPGEGLGYGPVYGHEGGGSGGYLSYVLKYACEVLYQRAIKQDDVRVKVLRNRDFQESRVEVDGKVVFTFAHAYGFRNIQNVIQKIKRKKCSYDFIEVMACPQGCLNGGGQLKQVQVDGLNGAVRNAGDTDSATETIGSPRVKKNDIVNAVIEIYKTIPCIDPRSVKQVDEVYRDWFGNVHDDAMREKYFYTQYHAVEKASAPSLSIKW